MQPNSHFPIIHHIGHNLQICILSKIILSAWYNLYMHISEWDSVWKEEETSSSASSSPGEATASQQPSGRTADERLGEGDETGTTKQIKSIKVGYDCMFNT